MSSILAIFTFLLLSATPVTAEASNPNWKPLESYAFPKQIFEGRDGPRTDSLLVYHKGEVRLERYERGYDRQKVHGLWSISKSISSLLFGIAEQKGFADRKNSICTYDEEVPKSYCDIAIQDLIHWTTGLQWAEQYENSRVQDSSVISMLYGEGFKNMRKFVLSHSKLAKAGTFWRYSSGDSHLLASYLPSIYKEASIHPVVSKHLMQPLGLETKWVIETDAVGRAIGSSHMYFNTPTLLAIAKLILDKGLAPSGERLLSDEWLQFIQQVPKAFKDDRRDHEGDDDIPGGGFWLNSPQGSGMAKPWPSAPEDTIVAQGHWGQYIIVIPSLDLIGIRTGDTRDKSFKLEKMIELLVSATVHE